ncbi:hypothetical protein WME99_20560 [Sorangium sp. So ce136]|uniref:hypothetical protein n=1 Tax=Sorangium sp. So ce136 TaxID=3133284 RepID=UPI003F0E4FC5
MEAKKQIGKRFPKGPLLSDAEWDAFKQLSSTPEGQTWLNASGMLTHGQVEQYLSNDNSERFRGFHLLHKPSKVVMASYVSRQMNGGEDGKRFEGTPPAAIALSMEARHTTDPARKEELTRQIDQNIANEWAKTLENTEPNDDAIKAMDQGAVLAPRTLKDTLTFADPKTLPKDEALARHRQSIEVLKNIFHLLQAGAEIYDAGSKSHVPLQGVPVAKLLSHGGRVNIQVPKGSPPYALTEFLGITDKNGNPTTGVFKRDFGTHHVALSKGKFKEEGGHFAMAKSKLDDTELYGMNAAIGGLGLKDFNGDIILPDGAHGHVFIGYRPPKKDRRGALQIGIETTGPGAPSTVGYVHNARSTEKTANPISSVGGLKQDKIGDEKGKNARTVDLHKLGDDWKGSLEDRADQFAQDEKENPTEAIKNLVGPREIPPHETHDTAPRASDDSSDEPSDDSSDESSDGSDRSERGAPGGDRRDPPGDAAFDPKRGAQDPGQGHSDQRPRGAEQAPKGNQPREMPGDGPEQMTARMPEASSPRPEAGTTQSAPGKAPERPGQPRPETTSQPPAQRSATAATAITTGMQAPARPPAATSVSWLGKRLGTGGHGFAGMVSNEGADQREQALADQYELQIGPDEDAGGEHFSHKMLDHIEKALGDLPREHVTGSPTLRKIIRDISSEEAASAYDELTDTINIVNPPKVPSFIYSRLNRRWSWQRKRMDRGAIRDYDGVDKDQDRALGITQDRHVMGGTSDVLANGNLIKWTMRHEIGHSVDKLIDWKESLAGDPRFGGWKVHSDTRDTEEVARAIFAKAGITDDEANSETDGFSLVQRFASVLHPPSRRKDITPLEDFPDDAASENPDLKKKLEKAVDTVKFAMAQPWTLDDGGASKLEVDGRIYHVDHYDNWVSYRADARNNAVSNYQFSTPAEWFAETYASYYDPDPAPRAQLTQQMRDFFANDLPGLVSSGQERWQRINENIRNAAQGSGPQPLAGSSAGPSAASPSAVTAGMSRNISTGTPSSGSRAASPPRDATRAPQDSAARQTDGAREGLGNTQAALQTLIDASKTWSHPATAADKQDAKELLGDIMRSQGVDRSLVDRLAELIDDPDSLAQHEFAICAPQSVLRTQLTSDLAGFARVVAAEFTGKLFDRNGEQIADFSLDNQGEHRATTSTQATDDPIQSVIRGELPLKDAPIGNKLLQNGVKKAGAKRADVENKGRAWSDKHVLDYLLARGLGKMLSKLAPEQYKADAEYTAGVIPGYLDKAATRDKDATGPSKKLGDLQLSADSLVTIFTNILGGDAQTMVDGDNYDVGRINDALARPEQAPFAVATFLDGKGLVERAEQLAKDPTTARPFDKAVTNDTASAHQVVLNGQITEDGDHYVVPLHTWEQSFSIKVKKDLLPSLFPVFTYGSYLPSQAPGANDATSDQTPAANDATTEQAPGSNPWSQLTTGGGDPLGTGGHGLAGLFANKGAAGREQALAQQYNLQVGPGDGAGGKHFSHKMLDHIGKALGDLPAEHVTDNPTLRAIIRDISSEEAASAYDELTDTINVVNPPKVPTFIYSRLNRRWNWQRKRMDRGAIGDYDGVDKDQDRALGITEDRHVMGGTSDVLANGNLIKWTMRHEIGHSIDKLIDWKGNLASDDRFGGWKVHSDTRDTEEVARAIFAKAGITDDEANSETDGFSLVQRFASVLHPPSRRKDITPLEDFPDAASENPDLKKKLEKAVDTIKFAMAQPWTLDDGGASKLEVDGRIYHVDHYDNWVSYRADARNNAVSNYQFSTPAEWFAETYASYYDPSPAPKAQLTQEVRDFFANDLPDLVTGGRERWQRINENIRNAEQSAGTEPPEGSAARAMTSGHNPAASDPGKVGEASRDNAPRTQPQDAPAGLQAGNTSASNSGDRAADPLTQTDEIEEEPEPPSERAPDPATSTPVEEVTWIVDKAVKNTIWRTDTGLMSRDRAKHGLSAIQGELSAGNFPADPTTAKEQLGGRFPRGPLFSDAEWSAFEQLSSTPQGQTWLNASGMLTHEQVEKYLSSDPSDNPERFRGFHKLNKASKVVLASYVSRQMNGGEAGKRFEGTPPAALALSMEARHTTDLARRDELNRLIDQGIIEEWSKTLEYTQPNDAATLAINKGAVLAPSTLLNTLTFTKGKELSKDEVVKRHGQSLEVLKNIFHLLQEGAEIYDGSAKSHVPLQDVPVAKLLSHGGRVNVQIPAGNAPYALTEHLGITDSNGKPRPGVFKRFVGTHHVSFADGNFKEQGGHLAALKAKFDDTELYGINLAVGGLGLKDFNGDVILPDGAHGHMFIGYRPPKPGRPGALQIGMETTGPGAPSTVAYPHNARSTEKTANPISSVGGVKQDKIGDESTKNARTVDLGKLGSNWRKTLKDRADRFEQDLKQKGKDALTELLGPRTQPPQELQDAQQRSGGSEQAPEGDERREPPDARGKAPERPGQPTSETTAQRPGSPATAITTGMQAPARPPAANAGSSAAASATADQGTAPPSRAPTSVSWLGKKLGTGGHGYAGMRRNEGADQREQALADQYELQIGPDEDADDPHFSHKMLDHIEKALGDLPPEHVTGSPTLRKIIRDISSEEAASAYDELTDTINIVNPPKVPSFIYSRLNRRWGWQRKRMDRGAIRDYDGVDKDQDRALGITQDRHVMGGTSDVLANGNLIKWTMRHEIGHSIDKLIDWKESLAGDDRFGGWKVHSDTRDLEEVTRAIFAKAGITDDEANSETDGFSLVQRFASVLHPPSRRKNITPLEDFPDDVASENPDLKKKLEKAVDTVKFAMAQPWTLDDGGASKLAVGGRIYQVDQYDNWVSYRSDARNNAVSNYQFSTPAEWFAETYASYYDPNPAPRAQLTQQVRDFFADDLPGLINQGRDTWERIRQNIAQSAGAQTSATDPSAITTGFNPAANVDPNSLGDGQTNDPADMLAGYNPALDSGDAAADPQSQLDEIEEEPPSERAPDPETSTPVEEVTWIVDKAVKNTIWRTDTGLLSRDTAKHGLSAIQSELSAGGFPADPTTAKEQLGGRFPRGPLLSDAEWSAFEQLSSTPQGQSWLNASGMLTHEQVEQYLSGNDDDNPERFRGFHKLHKASKVVLASYVSRQMNGGEDGQRFAGTPPAALALSMEARHTTDPTRRDELKRLIDQGIIEEWSRTLEYTAPNDAATTAINKGAVLAPKSLLNTLTFTKGKELSKDEVVKRHGQSLEVLKNVFHLLQEGAEIYDGSAKSHVPLQDVPVAKLLSHGGRVNVQIPAGNAPYALTEHLGITDSNGKPRPGVFKRFVGTHHVSFAGGNFKEQGGQLAALKAKFDDTELYGINLAVGGLGLKDFNGDVILPDGAHGHMFIGYRPPKPGRPGALQIGMETTGPGAPSTVAYPHNWRSTEKTANPISSVGGLKQDKIGDESTKNARTVDLGKLGSDWRKKLKDRADRFEQDLKQIGKDALTELLGPRTQPPQELQDAQQRSGGPAQEPQDDERREPPGDAPVNTLAGYNPALDSGDEAADPQLQTDLIEEAPEPPSERAPDPETSTPVDEVTWIVDKAVKNTIWRPDTGFMSRETAKRGLPAITAQLSGGGFPSDPGTAKEQIGGRFPKGQLLSDAEWSAFEQLSSTPQGQSWLNASGMLTLDEVTKYLSGKDDDNPERFRGFHQLHKASKVVLASYVSRQMNGGEDGQRFEGTPPAAVAISMEARHTTDSTRRAELKKLIDKGIVDEWSKTLEYTELNDDANTAIDKGAVLDPEKKLLRQPKKLSKEQVVDRHRQSLDVLKNVFHLLQEGAEIYDNSAKSHVPVTDAPVAKLLSHGGRVNVQIPPGGAPYQLTELLGITDKDGNPAAGVFKRSFGTHHVALSDGKFKEEGGHFAAVKSKLDDTELYGINLAVGGLGLKDFNGDVIVPDGAHGHMFIGYRPPRNDRPGALQIGIETTGPGAPSTVGYVHNVFSTEKTANPISSVGGLKQDKIGDDQIKNARTVDLGKLGSNWATTLRDRAERFEQDLALRGKDALTELVGPRTQPPQELQDAGVDRSGDTLAGAAAPDASPSPAPTAASGAAQVEPSAHDQEKTLDELLDSLEEQSGAWSHPATDENKRDAKQLLTGLLQRQNVNPSVIGRLRELIDNPASLSQSAFTNCALTSILYPTLKNDLATTAHLVAAIFTGKMLGQLASSPEADASGPQGSGKRALSDDLDLVRRVMTGEVPQSLGPVPTRPLVNGLRTAKAKGDSLKGEKDRKELDRHLLDHLLARGLVELLGPDALAKLEQQTDGARQPGVAAAQGDVLASARSVASIFSSALGANATVMTPSSPGGYDVARLDEALQQTDQAGFAIATVMDGKALWSAAKEHEASSTTPHASENVARLGGTATTAPHHATIDGPITDQGDSILVTLQSWGRTFPVRVNKEDMPKVFGAITYGTALPPRAPSPTVSAQEQTLADVQAGHNPDLDGGDEAADPQPQTDLIEEAPEPPSERAPDPETSTPVDEVTWIVDKAVKNTIWRPDTGFMSRERAKRGLPAITAQLSGGGFPGDPGTAKEQIGGRFPKGQLLSDAEWSAFEQLSSTPQGQSWLNASGMLTLDEVTKYLSGKDDDNPERFRGFHQLHKASKVVLASYVSRQMNGGEDGRRFEGTPPAAVAISMEARHTTDSTRRAELKKLIDKGIVDEWSKTLEYTELNDDANTAIDKGAVLDPEKKLLRQPKKLSKEQVVDRHRQSLDVLKNVFHLLQEGAEIYDNSAKSHVPVTDAPVAKLLSHGGRVNVQIPPGGAPYALTELLGITDKNGNPAAGVFKRSFGTHHVALSDGKFKEEGGHFAAVKSKLDDTELYGINLAVGGLGLKDFNGDVIVPDGAHGHMFIGYRPPRPGRQGALQIGIETTGPGAPSTVGYVHNVFSTEKTANPISSVGGLKQDKIGDDQIKNARTVDLSKLGSNWATTLRDRAERFEQDLALRGKDALTELVGPRTQPPQELLDAQQRASEQRSDLPEQESRDDERRDPPGDAAPDTVRSARAPAANEGSSRGDSRTSPDAPENMLAGYNPASDSRDEAADPQLQTDLIEEAPEPPSERAPDPETSTPVDEVTWIVDKAVKNTIWRPDTGFMSRERAKRGLPAITAQLSSGGFPSDPGTAKEQIGGRFPKGQLLSDAEWSAFEQLSSTPQGQSWLNASGMLTLDEVTKYLSGKDDDNPERFRGFHQLHKASKVVLASYVSRQMNGGEDGRRFEGTPPAAVAISMEARHTTDSTRRAELKKLIDKGIVDEWSKTLEYTELNDDANTAIDKGAVLDPEKKLLRQPKKLSKEQVVDRHRQSLDVLKNVFHLLQEGAEIYDNSAKSHVPVTDAPVAKLLSHGGRVNVQIPPGGAPYALTELLGITDKNGNPAAGVFKRSFGTHHVALSDGKFKEEGGHFAAVKSKLDDTELYGINLAVGGLGLRDFNGDVIVPDGAHGHMFIGYRPPRPGRQGALQIGIETTGPGAPSTVGYVHNVFSTEKTANPISSVGGLKQDKIGDDQIKNARTVDLSKLGSNWATTLRDRAERFEQDLALRGKDAFTELVGPRTQPPQELQDAEQRSGEPAQEPRDDERRDPPGNAAADMLAGYNPALDSGDAAADPQSQLDEIEEEPPSERAPDPATSTPVEEVTWIVDKAVKNTIWRTDTGLLSRDTAKHGLSTIQSELSAGGFPADPTTAKEQLGGRFPRGPLLSDAEWSAFVQLSSTPQGQTWLNASGMLTHEQIEQYLSGNDDDNPERFRGFHKLHKASKVVLASYVSRQMNGGESGKRFAGTPPAALALSMEARHTTDPTRRDELKRLIDQGIIEEWSRTLEYTAPNDAATTAINQGAVLAPKSLLNTLTFTKGKELSKDEVVKRHGQSLEVLKNIFHLLQEGAEIYDGSAKSHVPLQDVPVAKLLSHGGRVNVQIPPSSAPYALTEHLGITDDKGKPRPGVFKRFVGTHHVSFAGGNFKEQGGQLAALKAKFDDTELYGINLAVGGLGLKDFNGDVILPDGAHGHMFIGYRPPKPGRPGALQIGMETTGPGAPSTVAYPHNWRSTEKTANPISSVGGLKQDKIGDESTKNARTVDLGKLGSDWKKTLKDRADRFEQDLKQIGKDALTELLGPRTQPPQELQDAQQRSGGSEQAPRDNEPGDAPTGTTQSTGAPANVLAGHNPALNGESVALDPLPHTDSAHVEPSPRSQGKTLDDLLSALDEQSRAWSGPANDDLRQQAANSLAGLLESLNVDRAIVDRLRELIETPASLSQSAFINCGLNSALYTMLKGDLATTSHLVAALFTGRPLGQLAKAPGARELGAQQNPGKAVLSEDLDILRRVMTGEIPRALGPAPTRPLVNGLKTARAKRGGLTRAADRQQLDRHLLDHLLARGLVELLGQDAVAQHGKRTDDARQPGAAAAEGDLLVSANSIASLMRNALGAEVAVASGGPSVDDVARINETLRRTDRAGFAVATVSNGKALWEAAKKHRYGGATPRAPATVAPLGTGEAQSRHHFAIDGEIEADGDAFIVPVQSWGQSFPIRVDKADMPRLFEAITLGTYPPQASGAPAALDGTVTDGDVTIPPPIDALVRTLVEKSVAWSSPRTKADKQEAIALVTELLQQLGMDAKVVDRGEQGKDAPDDEHSACTCVR